MTKQASCPSEFALERWRFGELAACPEEAAIIAHIEACPACQRRHAELAQAALPPLDSATIWAAAWAGGTSAGPSPRAGWRYAGFHWLGAALAGAALAAALTVVLRRSPPDTLSKGSAWQLGVIAKTRSGAVLRLEPGASVAPGDRLRFEVFSHGADSDIAVLMLDSAGKVTQLAPAEGRSLSISGGRKVLLDEAVELDGTLGAEAIVVVACPRARRGLDVAAAARRALADAHGDPRQVGGLGTGCHEETFWMTKVER